MVPTGGCRRPHRPPSVPLSRNIERPPQGAPPTYTRTMLANFYALIFSDVAPGNPAAVYSLVTPSMPLAHLLPAHHVRAGTGSRF